MAEQARLTPFILWKGCRSFLNTSQTAGETAFNALRGLNCCRF